MNIKEQVQFTLASFNSNIVLIHSDIMQGFEVPFTDREGVLNSHITHLHSLQPGIDIWMPAFNYDFCKEKDYEVNRTPSQVGILTEYFRKKTAEWRTEVPVFSFTGIGKNPGIGISGTIDPFGTGSAFDYLYQNDAVLMHYGSQIYSSTILHYAERMSGCLSYRYDKLFQGNVWDAVENNTPVRFNFHVRPLNSHLDYNWAKISDDLTKNEILSVFKNEKTNVLLCKVKPLINFWIACMQEDPLYFLDDESRSWVMPMLDNLGRKFTITDFENP